MIFKKKDEILRCTFCGKRQEEVKKLIAGPSVFICNECVDICNEIIEDDRQIEASAARQTTGHPSPSDTCPRCGYTPTRSFPTPDEPET